MSRRAFPRLAAAWCAVLGASITPRRASAVEDASRASTSRDAYEDAVRELPLGELRSDVKTQLIEVVREPTLYRRLPVETIDCDPELYLLLVRYPEVVVNMWQLMGITKVRLERTAPYALDATDGAGTTSNIELVYGSRDKHIVYGTGYYEGPMFRRRINGRCVLLLRSGYESTEGGRSLVSNRLDVFVSLDNVGAEFVAKSLHPLVGKTADHNFAETTRFLAQISHQAEVNQPGMKRLVARLTNVDDSLRQRFGVVAESVGDRSATRVASKK
ncbi:MAG: hypothetical protein FJ297_14730 [Planctomycetes bacterium]|nr:hypothetical protein [Planctomycetota bacterium]